jgi:hypothetical protein
MRKLRVAAISLFTLLGVASSATTVSAAPGTDGQVKVDCTVPGIEYAGGTDDECASTGPEVTTYDAGVPRGWVPVPKSLSEPVTGSIGDVLPPPPPPAPPPPPPEEED